MVHGAWCMATVIAPRQPPAPGLRSRRIARCTFQGMRIDTAGRRSLGSLDCASCMVHCALEESLHAAHRLLQVCDRGLVIGGGVYRAEPDITGALHGLKQRGESGLTEAVRVFRHALDL